MRRTKYLASDFNALTRKLNSSKVMLIQVRQRRDELAAQVKVLQAELEALRNIEGVRQNDLRRYEIRSGRMKRGLTQEEITRLQRFA
jgi:hypothetical protein